MRDFFKAIIAEYPDSAMHASLYSLFCDDDEANHSTRKCSRTIPGTSIVGIAEPATHLNIAAMIYAWPHVCEKLSALGVFG